MKKMHLLAAAVAATLASPLAIAQNNEAPRQQVRIDADADGVVDRAEAAKFPRLAAKFDQLDTNKDGKLDASERRAQRQGKQGGKHIGMHGGGIHGLGMMRMDSDGDGRISKAEAQAAATRLNARFDEMDVNKDGYLDRSDMQARMAARRADYFTATDTNEDGYLSREEFAARQKAMHDKRRQARQPQAATGGRPMPTEAQRAERMATAFGRFDADRDGRISKAEFESAKPMGGRGDGKGKPRGR